MGYGSPTRRERADIPIKDQRIGHLPRSTGAVPTRNHIPAIALRSWVNRCVRRHPLAFWSTLKGCGTFQPPSCVAPFRLERSRGLSHYVRPTVVLVLISRGSFQPLVQGQFTRARYLTISCSDGPLGTLGTRTFYPDFLARLLHASSH